MGNPARESTGKSGKKGARKSARLPAPGAQVEQPTSVVSWEDVESGVVAYVIEAVTAASGAVLFMRSRDGGALGTRVLHDDHEAKTVWGRPEEDYAGTLQEIAKYYDDYQAKEE